MSQIPYYALAFVVLLGVLVTFHELGHYLAARACGVRVLRFSIGFGPALWERTARDGTVWAIALIPLGGYVRMLDEREAPVAPDELQHAFNRQSVGRRSLIVAAGPLANFFLAVLIFWGVFLIGTQELVPVLGQPPAASPLAGSGIRAGDEVLSVDDEAVASWDDVRWQLLRRAGREQVVLLLRSQQGEVRELSLSLGGVLPDATQGDPLHALGLILHRPMLPPVIGKVLPDSAGAHAGLRAGDTVLAVDGERTADWRQVVALIRAAPGRQVQVDVLREGQSLSILAQPASAEEGGQAIGRLGISVAEPPAAFQPPRRVVRLGVLDAAGKALHETWDKSVFTLRMFGKMLVGELSWRNLSGPVSIADYAGQSAQAGWQHYLRLMALLSISLGVLNLLPVPVLDGGHLMYHILEVVMRRPVPERVVETGQKVGLALLLCMMAFAFFNDISRLLAG